MQIDREALEERLAWLTSDLHYDGSPEAQAVMDEIADLNFIKDIAYLEDEGFIEIDEEGRMFPIGEAVHLELP